MTDEKKEKSKIIKYQQVLKRLSYFLVWSFILLRIFNIKILEVSIERIIPTSIYSHLIEYSYLIYLLLALILIKLIKFRNILSWLGGFVTFPLFLLYYSIFLKGLRIPLFIYNFITRISIFTKSLKYKVICISLFLLSLYLMFYISKDIPIVISMLILFILLVSHLLRRFITISNPLYFLQKVEKCLFKLWDKYINSSLQKDIEEWKKLDPLDEKYNKKREKSLKSLWFFNRFFKRSAEYLQSLKGNQIIVGYFICAIFFTLTFTVIIFALEYYGLDMIYSNNFEGICNSDFTNSLYLSFMTITTANLEGVIPMTGLARLFISLEVLCGIIIVVILFFVFASVTMEIYKKDLDAFINSLEKKEQEMKCLIEEQYYGKVRDKLPDVISSIQVDLKRKSKVKWLQIDDDEFPNLP